MSSILCRHQESDIPFTTGDFRGTDLVRLLVEQEITPVGIGLHKAKLEEFPQT